MIPDLKIRRADSKGSKEKTCEKCHFLFYRYCLNKNVRGLLNKFPDYFRMSTFIDSTNMKLYSPSK